jgi:hypothetical protein
MFGIHNAAVVLFIILGHWDESDSLSFSIHYYNGFQNLLLLAPLWFSKYVSESTKNSLK